MPEEDAHQEVSSEPPAPDESAPTPRRIKATFCRRVHAAAATGVYCAAFPGDPPAALVLTVARDGTAAVHDLSADAAAGDDPILRSFPSLGAKADVTAACLSPGRRVPLLYVGTADNTVVVFDCGTGSTVEAVRRHLAPLTAVALSPDGRSLASASADGSVKVWAVADPGLSRHPLLDFDHDGAVTAVDFSPDSRYAASASMDGTVAVFDLRRAPAPAPAWRLAPDPAGVTSVRWVGPDTLAAAGATGGCAILCLTDPLLPTPAPVPAGPMVTALAVALSGPNPRLLRAGPEGVEVLRLPSGRCEACLVLPGTFSAPACLAALGTDPSLMVVAALDGDGRLAGWPLP